MTLLFKLEGNHILATARVVESHGRQDVVVSAWWPERWPEDCSEKLAVRALSQEIHEAIYAAFLETWRSQ